MSSPWTIIKLGGSLLSPYETASKSLQIGQLPFDLAYTNELLDELKRVGKKCVLVVGGGFLNRWYLQQFKELKLQKQETVTDFHMVGMAASDINATLFRMFSAEKLGYQNVFPYVVKYQDYENLASLRSEFEKYQLVIAAGWKPGHSHDVDALMFASLFGVSSVYSFKNIDGIYTGDPRKSATAAKKKTLTWEMYRNIIKETTHVPGASFPIDAVAAQLAERMGIGFVVIDGRDTRAVRELMSEGLTTRGSTILPTVTHS